MNVGFMLIGITVCVCVWGGGVEMVAIKMDVFNVICMQCTLQKECVGINADCHSCFRGNLGSAVQRDQPEADLVSQQVSLSVQASVHGILSLQYSVLRREKCTELYRFQYFSGQFSCCCCLFVFCNRFVTDL